MRVSSSYVILVFTQPEGFTAPTDAAPPTEVVNGWNFNQYLKETGLTLLAVRLSRRATANQFVTVLSRPTTSRSKKARAPSLPLPPAPSTLPLFLPPRPRRPAEPRPTVPTATTTLTARPPLLPMMLRTLRALVLPPPLSSSQSRCSLPCSRLSVLHSRFTTDIMGLI